MNNNNNSLKFLNVNRHKLRFQRYGFLHFTRIFHDLIAPVILLLDELLYIISLNKNND